MSRRARRTTMVMSVLFGVVFGPILLFSWKDWRDVLLLGVQHPSVLVDYVWQAVGPARTPTRFATRTPDTLFVAKPGYIPFTGRTATALLQPIPSSTPPYWMSPTTEIHARPSGTPSRVPTPSPTRFVTRTATLIGSRTPTAPSVTQTVVTLRSTPTLVPTDTPRPTETPRPTTPAPTNTRPTSTRRPTKTPTPRPPPTTQAPPPTTEPPPTVAPTTPPYP